MNQTALVGRLADNAREFGNGGKKVLRFRIITKTGWNAQTRTEHTETVPCVRFDPSPKLSELLTQRGKGIMVSIQGRVGQDRFGDPVRYETSVKVQRLNIVAYPKRMSNGTSPPEVDETPPAVDTEDLPF